MITALRKRYKDPVPKNSLPVLETMIFAACLENSSYDHAASAYARLNDDFFDLNEIRVSSIAELEAALPRLSEPEWRALRIRNILQYVFEKNYEFEFEALRRKTLDLAGKQLKRIPNIGPFIRYHTLQVMLGSHLVPLDDTMFDALVWMGLCPRDSSPEQESEAVKSAVRKADVPLFCHLVRCVATDPQFRTTFRSAVTKPPKNGFDPETAPPRLAELFESPKKRTRAAATKSARRKKGTARKAAASRRSSPKKKSVVRSTKRTAAKKTARKKKKTTRKSGHRRSTQ